MAADNAEMQLMIPRCRQREEQEGEGRAVEERETEERRKKVCRAWNQNAVQICTFNWRLYANIDLDTFT